MKIFAISTALALITAFSHAAPTPAEPHFNVAEITFYGAAGAQYEISIPTDGHSRNTNNPLSVSKISNAGTDQCIFVGIDGITTTTVPGGKTVDVGPPQAQSFGKCDIDVIFPPKI